MLAKRQFEFNQLMLPFYPTPRALASCQDLVYTKRHDQ